MRSLSCVGQIGHVLLGGLDGGVRVLNERCHAGDRRRHGVGELVTAIRQDIRRGDQGDSQQRHVLAYVQNAHRRPVLLELHGVVVGEPRDRVDLARCESGLLGVADLLNIDVVRTEPGRGQRHQDGVPGLPRLTGRADDPALERRQVSDVGVLGHNDATGVALVEAADDNQTVPVGGGNDRLVRAGDHDLLRTGQQGIEQALLVAMMAQGDARGVLPAGQRQIEGGELNIGRVGQSDDHAASGVG